MADCKHMDFDANVRVARLTDGDNGPVNGYSADVTIKCRECAMPFLFIGLPGGSSPSKPTVSVDGQEARMPIGPQNETASLLDELGGAMAIKQ